MPVDKKLARLIRHSNWVVNLLEVKGGVRIPLPAEIIGEKYGKFTYLDPNGDVVHITLEVDSPGSD